jgi:hypothetical protein
LFISISQIKMHFLVAFSFLNVVFAIPAPAFFPSGDVRHIPIQRKSVARGSVYLDEVALVQSIRSAIRRYKPETVFPDIPGLSASLLARDGASVPLTGQNAGGYDRQFYGNCTIGDQSWALNCKRQQFSRVIFALT